MTELVIFDCDGVLVDSEFLVVAIEVEMLAELGVALTTADIVQRFVGLSDQTMRLEIERDWGVRLPDSFDDDRHQRVMRRFETDLEPVAGIAGVLEAVTTARCVASSSALARVARSLELTDLSGHLAPHLFSASMVERGKPAPDLFLHAAAALGVAPERCLVVEDSPHGVIAGCAAGMTTIGFTAGRHCGPDQADRLLAAGAGHVAATSAELLDLLAAHGAT